jgi:hypothetical protein
MKKIGGSPQKKSSKPQPNTASLELDPDAWPKFEGLVKAAAKMGHKPHDTKLGKIATPRGKAK